MPGIACLSFIFLVVIMDCVRNVKHRLKSVFRVKDDSENSQRLNETLQNEAVMEKHKRPCGKNKG